MQKPTAIAKWSTTRDRWETQDVDLFSGLSDVFSETLPPSGMTRDGQLFELPTWEPRMGVPGSSLSPGDEMQLLRTPCAAEAEGGPVSPATARANGQTLRLTGQILDLIHPGSVK